MRTVRAHQTVSATVADVEAGWYDTSRWPTWVDGLDRVVEVTGGWPAPGALVTWESNPAGRGQVTERVVAHRSGEGQTVEVHDASISGRQSVAFMAGAGGVHVDLVLEYRLNRRSLMTSVVDALFIRRAMALSLARTLDRFAARMVAAAPRLPGGPHAPGR